MRVRQAKPRANPYKLADGAGLHLLVTTAGGKWWRFRYRFLGKAQTLSMGTYPDVSLADARDRRDEARKLLAQDPPVNPSTDRKERKAAAFAAQRSTFEAVAREWFEEFSPPWAPAHAATVIHRLEKDVFPHIGSRPIADIDTKQVLDDVLDRIKKRGALDIAHRVCQTCSRVFRYAMRDKRVKSDPTFALRGTLAPADPGHFGALTEPAAVGALMRDIGHYPGSFIIGRALKLAALTFPRPGELRQAEWTEIDLDGADGPMWRIPAAKMKMRREHWVPLSRQAVDLIRELRRLTGAGKYLFPNARNSTRPMGENTLTEALYDICGKRGVTTAHGFRATASTLLREKLGWPNDPIERQLAHIEPNASRGAYDRAKYLKERRKMMQEWANYLDKLESEAAPKQPTAALQVPWTRSLTLATGGNGSSSLTLAANGDRSHAHQLAAIASPAEPCDKGARIETDPQALPPDPNDALTFLRAMVGEDEA
jgi:integrase